ncbi:aldehyde dehydrogenase family 3 member B1 isoform X1 [Microcaecilia unicolor]|uniref:Aldehyde dehydrogenase n=1 Tax=Microcaecilia unicolor TaxID=1415580 RepID=A0A6P7ZG97_9AMPH|nr:aldehyde dehydrogenase family 3 member B1-like isoform X1 [Microcaecilia unicolor]XP_030074435.1 aldehyde dehydrogenase family 3 member B1-like isoform X1 [Microcaecilia unicolor]XP_030074436.1 aldehyde dehydrogenase family 3 member B1-like isoform X1 [Microcaecilia unicolor]
MDLSSASPAARWLRALRRTVSGENTSMKPSNSVCEDILKKLRGAFIAGRTKPFKFRIAQLQAIVRMLKNNENLFVEALENDMHRPKFETILLEITTVKNEALYAINNLEKWMQPEYIRKDMTSIFDDCFVHREPMGVVLIIGAWTFPIQLCLIPLIGAIAAGNCILLRLPAISSRASELLQKLLSNYLDSECYQVIGEGLIDLAEILESTFDHIFFTGDNITAKTIMQSACKHLTPVSLVLGGKNPCYVDKDCDVLVAARRIALARFTNAGQSSLAPTYVLCHVDVYDKLIQALYVAVQEFYGRDPRSSAHFGRLATVEQYRNVKQLLTCGNVAFGGDAEETDKYIAPTVLIDVRETDPVTQQDILGPVLPVVTVKGLEEAIQFINQRERPLATYVYSDNSQVIAEMMSRTSSGSFCSNDSAVQNLYLGLPCCGAGIGGGLYGGKYGFDTFSQSRAYVLRHSVTECVTRFRYPPYLDTNLNLMLWVNYLSHKDGWCQIL